MKVRYIYSACVVIETPDVKILCDPWFTQGAFEGAWYQYPVLENPIDVIGEVDYIWISHLHADHFDPKFLTEYGYRYPHAKKIIGNNAPAFLANLLRVKHFKFDVVEQLKVGDTEIYVLPNNSRPVDIDNALVVKYRDQSVVNINDCPIDLNQVKDILSICGRPTVGLLPYCGATNHPQSFDMPEDKKIEAARIKQEHFLNVYKEYIELLNPKCVIPFAGKYWLGGPLSKQNKYRGIPDATVASKLCNRALVLADGGKAVFDLDTMKANTVRTEPYDEAIVQQHLDSIEWHGYDYEKDLRMDPHQLQLLPLLKTALEAARKRFPLKDNYWVCIRPKFVGKYYCFNVSDGDVQVKEYVDMRPCSEIFIDDRLLYGLLTRLYHWNNAMGGSHYVTRRTPDVFNREVNYFLDFLHI